MIYTHRTLLPDEEFTEICPIYQQDGKCAFIAVAQGTKLLIIDPFLPNDQIRESYPFLSPIKVVESVKATNPTVFVLLRNLNYFILELPKIIRYGSLYKPNGCFIPRNILSHSSFFSYQPQNVSSTTTAIINFNEQKIIHASHPNFIALHTYHDIINIIPLNLDGYNFSSNLYTINLVQPNLVSMAFLGPTLFSVRLAYIADSSNSSRILVVYKYIEEKDEFECEFEYGLPADSHFIISIQPELQSTLAILTSDGVIRINAPEGLPQTIERLSFFMPPIILNACHFYDDIYLLCDSCGGLSGLRLPVEGPIVTENCKIVGPTSGIVAIDDTHFIISSPFGDLIGYTFTKEEDSINITEFSRIRSIGPIFSLGCNNEGLIIGSGRGDSSSIRLFEKSLSSKKIGEVKINNCLNIFTALGPTDPPNSSIYICLCFYNSTRVIKYDKKTIETVEWPSIPIDSTTLLFSDISDGCIAHLSTKQATIIDRFSGEATKSYSFPKFVVAATLSPSYLITANESNIIQIIELSQLKQMKKFQINKATIFIAATDTHAAVYLIDNSIYLFCISDISNSKSIVLPTFTIPVSMAMVNENMVIVGTNNGNIIKITNNLETIITQNYGCDKIVLKPEHSNTSGVSILCSGGPPFIIINGQCDTNHSEITTHFICAEKCEDISKSGDIMCCLDRDTLSFYETSGEFTGTTKTRQTIPNMLNFVFVDSMTIICHVEERGNHSLVKYVNGVESNRYENRSGTDKTPRISFFKYLILDGKGIVVIGDDHPSVTLLDDDLNKVSWQKMLGMPLSATVFQQYLVVSRENTIDFFMVKCLYNQYEMDRKAIVTANFMPVDFLNINETYLVASDIQQALIVYKTSTSPPQNQQHEYDENQGTRDQLFIEKVAQDCSPKQLTSLALFDNKIFAASLSETVYAYSLDEKGVLVEIGAFQCCAQVTSFAARENNLFYGTASGGIGLFTRENGSGYLELQSIIEEDDDIVVLSDWTPKRQFEWDQPDLFVDIDNLKVLKNLTKRDLSSILAKAKIDPISYNKIYE